MKGWTRLVDLALLVLAVVATVTGVFTFGLGAPSWAGAVVAVHGASGLGLLLLVPAKTVIARRGLKRPGRPRKVTSVVLVVLMGTAVGSGSGDPALMPVTQWLFDPVPVLPPARWRRGGGRAVVVPTAVPGAVTTRPPRIARPSPVTRRGASGT